MIAYQANDEQVYTRFFNLLQRTMITKHLRLLPTSFYGLWESTTERNLLSIPWNCHQRLLLSLSTLYMAQTTDDRTTNSISGKHGRMDSLFAGFGRHRTSVDITPFTDYIITQLIQRGHSVWNHFNTDGDWTTNHLDACHGQIKKKVQHCHPNIFTITQTFNDVQASNEIHRLQASGAQRPRPRKYRNIDSQKYCQYD